MLDSAGEARMNSKATISHVLPNIDEPVLVE